MCPFASSIFNPTLFIYLLHKYFHLIFCLPYFLVYLTSYIGRHILPSSYACMREKIAVTFHVAIV